VIKVAVAGGVKGAKTASACGGDGLAEGPRWAGGSPQMTTLASKLTGLVLFLALRSDGVLDCWVRRVSRPCQPLNHESTGGRRECSFNLPQALDLASAETEDAACTSSTACRGGTEPSVHSTYVFGGTQLTAEG